MKAMIPSRVAIRIGATDVVRDRVGDPVEHAPNPLGAGRSLKFEEAVDPPSSACQHGGQHNDRHDRKDGAGDAATDVCENASRIINMAGELLGAVLKFRGNLKLFINLRPARSSARARSNPTSGRISYGTTATINTTQRKYVEAVPLVPPYPAAVAGAYSLEVQVYRGYWMVDWFKRQFGAPRGPARRGARRRAGGALRRPRPRDAAGLDGPPPPADLVAGRPDPGPRGQGRDHRLRRRPHAGPTSTGRSSRASPTRCARAASGRPRARRCRSASCASPAAARSPRPRSSSRPTSSGCRRAGRTPTRRRGSGAAIDAAVGLGIHPDVRDAPSREMTHIAEVLDPDPDATRSTTPLYDGSTARCTTG